MPQWHMPVDPECPVIQKFDESFWDDPMTLASGCGDEISEDFYRRHRRQCRRCQEFGAANIEVR